MLFVRAGLLGASMLAAASLASCSSSSSSSSAVGTEGSHGSGAPDAAAPETSIALRVPQLGPVPDLPVWPDDPPTPAKIALGSDLFFDVRLSGSGHTACTSCHGYQTAFQDNLITAIPDRSYPNDRPALTRNTLSFYDIVYAPVMRWDGSQTDLASAMAFPWSEANMNLG